MNSAGHTVLSEEERREAEWAVADEASAELFFTESREAHLGFGPLHLEARLITAGLECRLYLSGVRIGGGTLTPEEDELCLTAQVGLVKAKTRLWADFTLGELWVFGEVCVRSIGDWSCRHYQTRIFAW